MAASLTPRVRLMTVCDSVRESKIETGVFHLKGVRQKIVANALPFVPPRLSVFLLLSNPRGGEFPGYVIVVHDRTNKAIFFAHLEPTPRFDTESELSAHEVSIRCVFPEVGQYSVQLWFFQEHGPDVMKGELPFSVQGEGG